MYLKVLKNLKIQFLNLHQCLAWFRYHLRNGCSIFLKFRSSIDQRRLKQKRPSEFSRRKIIWNQNHFFLNLIDYPKKRYKTVADPYSGKTSQNLSKTMIITAWLTAVGISSLPVIEKQFNKDHAESNECSYSSSFPW